MKIKERNFIIYSFGIILIWILVIFFSSSLQSNSEKYYILIIAEKLSYFLAYGLLFMLIYNCLLMLFRYKISILARFRSLQEKLEDQEFTLIIEFLLMIISAQTTIMISIIELYIRKYYLGKSCDIRDFIIILMGIILFSVTTYLLPHTKHIDRILRLNKK